MKRLILIIMLLFVSLYASELEVTEFKKLANDYHAVINPIFDFDKQYCTAIKIEFPNCQLLALDQKIFKKEIINKNECYLYISHKEHELTFKTTQNRSVTVKVPRNGLIMGMVYYIKLEIKNVQNESTINNLNINK